jgi:hypothetical protein
MASLSVQQLASLLTLLSKDSADTLTLEALCHRLSTNFPKSDAFKVGSAITHLLQYPGNKDHLKYSLILLNFMVLTILS